MYWFERPPYLRWAGAALLLIAAWLWDARGPALVHHPYATADLAAGTPITEESIEWRAIPEGLLPAVELSSGPLAADVGAGDPIHPSHIAQAAAAPDGWWALPIESLPVTRAGTPVLLVVLDPPLTLEGVVVTPAQGDRFSLDFRPATVAVPPAAAASVAAASAQGLLVAAVQP